MAETFTKRVVLDTSQADRAMSTLDRSLQKVGTGINTVISGMDKVGRSTGFSQMANAATSSLSKLTSGLGSAISGIDKFSKNLAPWNQSLELAGKAVKFATAGLDAYAKTSTDAAREVSKLKKEFEGYRDSILQSTGAITVALLKPVAAYEEQWKAMMRIQNSALYKQLYQSGGLLSGDFNGNNLDAGTKASLAKYGITFSKKELDPLVALGSAIDDITESIDKASVGWKLNGERFVGDLADSMKKTADEAERATAAAKRAAEAVREAAALRRGRADARATLDSATRPGGNITDVVGKPTGFSTSGMLGAKAETTVYSEYGVAQDESAIAQQALARNLTLDWAERMSAIEQQNSLMDRLGIPKPDEWALAAAGAQAFSNALGPALQAAAEGTMSAGQIFKKGAGTIVKALGDQLAAHAAAEAVTGAAMLMTLNPKGALHLGAAGLYGAGAVAAYAVASKLGAGSGSVATSAGASGGVSTGVGGATGQAAGGGRSGSPGGVTNNYTIVYGEHFYSESTRMRQIDADRYVRRAIGSDYSEQG